MEVFFMTYFVGIDIAKYHHDCFIMNQDGEVIRNVFTFSNNQEGFNSLLDVLAACNPVQSIKIGFEATGHYGYNLMHFLQSKGYDFMEIHPVLIKRFSQASTLRKTKTDKVDATLISSYLTTVDFKPYLRESYHMNNLKSLTRARDSLIKERSLQLVRLTNVLDKLFPEFKPFFNRSLKSASCQYILINYSTPSKISRMNQSSYDKMKSKLRRPISYARFCDLRDLAKNTIGVEDPILVFQLQSYLTLYENFNTMISDTEKLIIQEFSKIDSHLQSIPGIGIFSAASIYAEITTFSRFSNPNQITAYSGIEPSTHQSGESNYGGRMVKKGSSYLRQYLMNIAETCIIHNTVLYDFYRRKRKEGKKHRVALSHVAKKLIRIIYTLETNGLDFDPDKLR
jgi:transposase